MQEKSNKRNLRFLSVFGLAVGGALLLSFAYTIIVPGLTLENWGNSMCFSAFIVAAGSVIPVFFDAGRGVAMAGRLSAKGEEQKQAMEQERQKRESGMKITFALAAATFVIGLISAILSLI